MGHIMLGAPGLRSRGPWRGYNILDNPYFYGSTIVAMLAVNAATLVWCVIVLAVPDALMVSNSRIGRYVNSLGENAVAGVFAAVALIQMLWIILKLPPLRFGYVGYAVLAFAWTFVFLNASLIVSPILPISTAGSAVMAVLALYAFRANPKPVKRQGANGMAPPR